ncbi:metal-dependent hydrolase [Thalassotalea insulae]|uniref:Metal-dependent hydrolase n=1 Tax=Thalassotalea insulae TaxID=2056778 RepID=A0ABQ6GWH9_9GAMM|nr:TatD family hydrolase [Thalassotalea insulae]GLX79684.1 metal-dependent hydrolase [Thalassotalea insulae]
MPFTDSHCHIDFTEFQDDLTRILADCYQKNILTIIAPAVAPKYWQRLLDLCAMPSQCKLYPCLGIHPWYLTGLNEQDLLRLAEHAIEHLENIVAIGEIGLDGVIAKQQDNLKQQLDFFEFQLYLANQVQKPVIIHHRRSHNELIEQLKKVPVEHGGVIHGFSGSFQQASNYIDMGFKLGIGGTITYPRAEKTIKAVARLPLSALVLETDAPAMPIAGEQGKYNSPLRLPNIFHALCQIRTESPELIEHTIEENVKQLFFPM